MSNRENVLVQYMNGTNPHKAAAILGIPEANVVKVYSGMDQKQWEKVSEQMTKLLYTGFAYARSIGAGHKVPRGPYVPRALRFAAEISQEYTRSNIAYPLVFKLMRDRNLTVRDLAKLSGIKEAVANKILDGRTRLNLDWAYRRSLQMQKLVQTILDISGGTSFEELFLRDTRKPYIHRMTGCPVQQNIVYPQVKEWILKNRIAVSGIARIADVSTETVSRVLSGACEVTRNPMKVYGRKKAVTKVVHTILRLSGLEYESAFGAECARVHRLNEPQLKVLEARRTVNRWMTPLFGRVIPLDGNESRFIEEANRYQTFEVRVFDKMDLFFGSGKTFIGNQADAIKEFKKCFGSSEFSAQFMGIDHRGQRHGIAIYGSDGTREAKLISY